MSGAVVPGATVVLISEAQKARTSPVVTNGTRDFVVANLVVDTDTVQVELPSFKTLSRSGVSVGPGTRVSVGKLTIEVGGVSETVTVEIPLIHTDSGDRSFRVEPDKLMSLPFPNRTYDALLGPAPGVDSNPGGLTPASRTGSNASNNFMVDGVTGVDLAINRVATPVSVEAVAEVKVVTSSITGRASWLTFANPASNLSPTNSRFNADGSDQLVIQADRCGRGRRARVSSAARRAGAGTVFVLAGSRLVSGRAAGRPLSLRSSDRRLRPKCVSAILTNQSRRGICVERG